MANMRKYPISNRVSYTFGGAGFLPSTVGTVSRDIKKRQKSGGEATHSA